MNQRQSSSEKKAISFFSFFTLAIFDETHPVVALHSNEFFENPYPSFFRLSLVSEDPSRAL